MRARMLCAGAALVCAGLMAGTAHAATLVNSNGKLTYTGTPGNDDSVSLLLYGSLFLVGPIADGVTGCDQLNPTRWYCAGVTSVVAELGDGDDLAIGGSVPSLLSGGPGDDQLALIPPATGSVISGGPGLDVASFGDRDAKPVSVTLDGLANDGVAGALFNVESDVEDVTVGSSYWPDGAVVAASYGPIRLVGNAGPNHLTTDHGDDSITGGAGSDVLNGRGGDDVLHAQDGEVDRVECGNGVDTAYVDAVDDVSESCEHVHVRQPPAVVAAVEDATDLPPRLEFKPGDALEVTATDDRGVASVRFVVGGDTLCTVTAAPFTCAYTPRVQDVGRTTVVAVATDTAGQTATAIRTLAVPRFKPASVSLAIKRQGRRFTATGKVALPPGVPCAGEVAVKAGRTTRSGKLRRDCTFRIALPKRGRYVATYLGTAAIEPRRSAARRAR